MWLDYQINKVSYSLLSVLQEKCLISAESDRDAQLKEGGGNATLKRIRKGEFVPDHAGVNNVIYSVEN